jgi:hypothetical protein
MMNKRVLIWDTSVLCCWLKVSGKETAGSGEERWTYERINRLLNDREGSTFVLPVATLIETGNHIAQVKKGDRYALAEKLAKCLQDAANESSPWAAFTEQAHLWETKHLCKLAESWPELAKQKLSIGDATIKDVADYYYEMGNGNWTIEILTGDNGLKAYEPETPLKTKPPRRRRK